MNDSILQALGFGDEVQLRKAGLCTMCKKPVEHVPFRDQVSVRESHITGMCQTCQDEIEAAGDCGYEDDELANDKQVPDADS